MRHLRRTFALGAAVCASATVVALAAAAAPALAGPEFTASRVAPSPCSEATPCKTKGRGITSEFPEKYAGYSQQFKFGQLRIDCEKASTYANTPAEGAITWESSQNFATEVKFGKCLAPFKSGTFTGGIKTYFNEGKPVKFVYTAAKEVEFGTGETEAEIEVAGGETSFKIAAKMCKINWPSQHLTAKEAGITFSNTEVGPFTEKTQLKKFPSGFQKRLVITNAFKHLLWNYESGQCVGEGGFEEEAAHTEGHFGEYHGALEEEVTGGNLSFVP
jgi:hypothetical protein